MLVTLDFETYYDADYTLKKLSTSEYVRDPRFEALNCAIMVDDGSPVVHWGHDAIQYALDEIDWDDAELLAHHAHFEGLLLSHHFGVLPRTYRDTLSMARALFPKGKSNRLEELAVRLGVENKLEMPDFKGMRLADIPVEMRPKVEAYVTGDVVSCYQAYQKMLPQLPPEEMELISTTVRMFARPRLLLDRQRVEEELAREVARKEAEVLASGVEKSVLMSNDKLAAKMIELGVQPPKKISGTTKKLTWAMAQTDLEFTALQNHPDPAVAALVKGRLAVKGSLGEKRCVRLLKAGENDQSIPVYLNYCGAHTTRWSGGDKLNFQNMPRAEFDLQGNELPNTAALRRSLLAPPGYVLCVVDSSQIEVRVLAWLAGERWLLDAFARGEDAYCVFGTKAFGRVITKKGDPAERQLSKVCVLALGYSMGAWKLQQTFAWGTHGPVVNLAMEVCEGFVRTYRSTSRSITALWDTLNALCGDMAVGREGSYKCLSWGKDFVLLPNGMTLHYPETRATTQPVRLGPLFGNRVEDKVVDASYLGGRSRQKLYGGLMTENLVQALARVIVASQMAAIDRRYPAVMMSHDEVVYLVPEAEAQEGLDFGLAAMRTRPAWGQDIPLDAEGGFARNYSK